MSKPQLTIRKATSADKAAILAFCASTWDNGDYIAEVWDEWQADPDSSLLVGTLDAQPVALAHVELSGDEAWFEGLRVDAAVRGRGFARQMLGASCVEAQRRGASVLRLLTNRTNAAMARLLPQLGFELRFDACWYTAPAITGPTPRPADLDVDRLWHDLEFAPLLRDTGGLYAAGWSFVTPTRAHLKAYLAAGQVVQLPAIDGWAVVMTDGESERIGIALMAGDVPALLNGLRALPAAQRQGELRLFAPVDSATAHAALRCGYLPRPQRFGIFERSL